MLYGEWSEGTFTLDPDTGVAILHYKSLRSALGARKPLRLTGAHAPGWPADPTASEATQGRAAGEGWRISYSIYGDTSFAMLEGVLTDPKGQMERVQANTHLEGEQKDSLEHYRSLTGPSLSLWGATGLGAGLLALAGLGAWGASKLKTGKG